LSTQVKNEGQKVNETPELDELYKRVIVQVRGHDQAVLDSYQKFVQSTSNELQVNLADVRVPERFIERWTVLKSRFSNRKHLRQYEMRTYFREFEFKHLTGSTCDTLLEFIQRNLPEGIAMHVHKTRILPLPNHMTQQQQ
jgi:small subunit ribosomal protein S10